MNQFQVYFKDEINDYHIYNYGESSYSKSAKISFNMNTFEMFKGYEASNDGLKRFADDIVKWRNEILNCKTLKKQFDYFDDSVILSSGKKYFKTHSSNIKSFLRRLIPKQDFDNITLTEEIYYNKCSNGGLIYHKNGLYENITTYDKEMFYASILSSNYFQFPTKAGQIYNFFTIPKNSFIYGIYHISVQSNDERFNKIFAFSKDNYYTHYSLNFVKYYNKEYNGDIKMTVLSNKCLKYRFNNELKISGDIFKIWYRVLKDLRKELPNNKLIKKIASTTWGELQQKNTIVKEENEMKNYQDYGDSLNVNVNRYFLKDFKIYSNDQEVYTLIDLTKPIYKYQYRLKPFLTSYARWQMALLALKNIDNVVRIQTDSISYDIPIEIKAYLFKRDEKKSGTNFEVKGNSLTQI